MTALPDIQGLNITTLLHTLIDLVQGTLQSGLEAKEELSLYSIAILDVKKNYPDWLLEIANELATIDHYGDATGYCSLTEEGLRNILKQLVNRS